MQTRMNTGRETNQAAINTWGEEARGEYLPQCHCIASAATATSGWSHYRAELNKLNRKYKGENIDKIWFIMYYIRTAGLTVCISVHPDKERRKNIYHKATVIKTKTKQKGTTTTKKHTCCSIKKKKITILKKHSMGNTMKEMWRYW